MKIYLIGVGMGNPDTLTVGAVRTIESCELLIGAPRLLTPWMADKKCLSLVRAADIAGAVAGAEEGQIAILLSGDTGFYSGAKALRPLLSDYEVETVPGLSSLSYFAARLGTTWQDVHVVSAHGRSHNAVGEIQCHGRTFVLTGGESKVQDICHSLCSHGMGHVKISVGEHLSYPHERILSGTAEELVETEFADLSVLLVEHPNPVVRPFAVPSLPDSAFGREHVPMTKEEVRSVVLSKLRPAAHHTIWDVGAGTGSVTVECALAASAGWVFAVERKREAVALIQANAAALGAPNVTVVPGVAPEVLVDLPAPDRVFVGGSGGGLGQIIKIALEKNPAVRMVIAAVTLETLHEAETITAALGLKDVDIVQVGITRIREVGRYHMMDGQNPVWLVSGGGAEE